MTCQMKSRKRAELLVGYCAQTLPEAQAAEFESHLKSCEECKRLVAAQRASWKTLDDWTPAEIAPEFNARLYARIEAEQAESWWRRLLIHVTHPLTPLSFYWKPGVSLAAACAVLAVGLMVHIPNLGNPTAEVHVNKVDIEQAEKTLEDLDMLTPPPAPGSPM